MEIKREQVFFVVFVLIIIGAMSVAFAFAYSSEQKDGTTVADSGADWSVGALNNARNDDGSAVLTPEGEVATSYLIISGFTTTIPSGSKIVGIAIRDDGYYTTAGGICAKRAHTVDLSWNGGSNYTTGKATGAMTTMETTYTLGSATDTWGRAWATSELAANFYIRLFGVRASCVNPGIGHACEYLSRTIYYRPRRRITISANFVEHLAALFKSNKILLLHPAFQTETSVGRVVVQVPPTSG